jgi:drug/metabolite transporter (DMT)-like permease
MEESRPVKGTQRREGSTMARTMFINHARGGRHVAGLLPAAIAVTLWSLAPVLAGLAERVPPLQLTALCLAVSAFVTWPVVHLLDGPAGTRAGAPPLALWLGGPWLVIGALGFYFAALRLAPAAEAALVTYTWPVLFVIASELVQSGRVRGPSLAGAALAYSGAALVLVGPEALAAEGSLAGYACAFASGTCWASFSLAARMQRVPTTGVMPRLFVLGAAYALAGHALLEPTLWPIGQETRLMIVLIGAGPYGLAFLAWDRALRRGPSSTVGTLAYAVPVLSAVLLVAAGMATASWRLPLAAAAVVGGSFLAGRTRLPGLPRLRPRWSA